MEYAGVALRFVAVLIDFAVLIALVLVVALFTGGAYSTGGNGAHNVGVEAEGWWPFLVFLGYYVVLEATSGRTIGKRAVGLRVVDENGDWISWGQALGRNLLRVVDALFFYLIAAIAAWSSPKRQRLGDRAANTFVIHDRGEWRERARLRPPVYEQPDLGSASENANYYTHERFMEDLARAKWVRD
jgi:uncharacterized RDD family membrane protein YckC